MQDMYPSDAGLPGSDFSGTVPVVAGNALPSGLRSGDAVFGLHPGCLGTVMLADPNLRSVTLKPAAMTHREASTAATIFLTVEVALRQVILLFLLALWVATWCHILPNGLHCIIHCVKLTV